MAVSVNGGALQFDAVINASQFNAAIGSIERQLAGLTETANKEAGAIDSLVRKSATAIAAYASFAAATNFVSDIVRVRGEFQQLEVAFETMLGSKQKADQLLAEITEFAATTPFELKDVAAATKQLLAFGISSDKVKDTLRSLGDISSGIGAPLGEIAYLFGTIKTQGRAMTVDVRQFAQRGIPIYQELAKIFDVTTDRVQDFIEAGKVGFPEIEQVFKNLTAEGSQFGGLMEAQSKTLLGQISNLRDAFSQMLNEIGRSGEGIFADAISSVKFLVDNYQTIIDILKVLVITYGSYRAAIIATNALSAISAAREQGLTVALFLKAKALQIAQGAQALLNRTMLANPAVAVAAGIGLLVSALAVFGKQATLAKSKAELLADAQEKVADSMADQEAKIRPYVEALKNANLSEEERINIYNKLKEIDPKIVEGLNAKTIAYENITERVKGYLTALRNQYALEANKEALQASIKNEQEIQKSIDRKIKKQEELNKKLSDLKKSGDKEGIGLLQFSIVESGTDQKVLLADLEAQKKVSEELGSVQVKAETVKQEAKLRTLAVIDEEIKAEKEKQRNFSTSSVQYQQYQASINKLEEERKRIVGETKAETRAQNAEDNKALALLEKRKDLLEQIADRVKDAAVTNRTKEQTELDKINERYDALIDNIDEYNKKVQAFNKTNPKKQVQQIGQVAIVELNQARTTELDNATLRADAEKFKKSLEDKQRVFEQFEEAKKQVGIEKTKELFAEQTKGYESFLKLLQEEGLRLLPKIQFGIANVGEIEKFKAITDQVNAYNKKKYEENIEEQKRQFIELLTATSTFNQQKGAVNEKYDRLEKTLSKELTVEEVAERKRLLKEGRQEELDQLNNDLIRKSALYKKLNQDILGFSRETIKQQIKDFQKQLKDDTSLTPQMKADIQGVIDQYNGLLDSTNATAKKYNQLAGDLASVSGIFGNLAGALEGLNDGLADTLQTLSDITGVAANAAGAIAQFASGNIIGGIGSAVSAIVGLFSIGKKAKESRKQAEQEILDFNQRILSGEIDITQEYRNRQREQAKLNELKLEGLQSEKRLLEEQKNAILSQYDQILSQLNQETFVADLVTKKSGGVLGIGRKTKTVEIRETLNGLSFDEMEKLFSEGKLTGRAKELFEILRKIKQEGADIDGLLAENAEAAKEIFTGTTADSIVDSIADGFASGKRSASDFADNFKDLMRNAMIESLKLRFLEGPLQAFFEEFAGAAQSGDQLTSSEIDQLQSLYNSIITNAQAQFDQLQQISGIDLAAGSGGQGRNLTGAIKGITETQADLLAGQFGGLRITALEQLNIARVQLTTMNMIQVNTGTQIVRMNMLLEKLQFWYEVKGIKII